MEIRYCMTRREAWRFNSRMLFRQWIIWVLFAFFAAMLTGSGLCQPPTAQTAPYWQLPSAQTSPYLHYPNVLWLLVMFLSIHAMFVGGCSALIWGFVGSYYPDTEPPLLSTTVLTPEGLQDTRRKIVGGQLSLTPIYIPWQDVTRIYRHGITQTYLQDADIYFQRKAGCNVIPRAAFDSPREGQQFYDQAVAYWNAAKNGMLSPAEDAAVWPPAPRPGA